MSQPRPADPLPIRIRPLPAETAESYIRRLARANHLKPSYLRRHLAKPQAGYGPIDPERLAAAAGRSLPALRHALPDLARQPRTRRSRHDNEETKQRNHARKQAVYTAIRDDAAAGLSKRALERTHHVGRRTVAAALASATPPERKTYTRAPTVHGLHLHIDTMIEANPTIPATSVWAQLLDEHDTTASYGAIRAYITRRKLDRARPQTAAHDSARGETAPAGAGSETRQSPRP